MHGRDRSTGAAGNAVRSQRGQRLAFLLLKDCLEKILEPIQQICPTGKSPKSLSISILKNILIYRSGKSVDILIHPVPPKGRVAIVTFAGRAAVAAGSA